MRKFIYFTIGMVAMMIASLHAQDQNWVQYTNGNNVYSTVHEGNLIWVGTSGCLIKINKTTGERTFYNTANSGLPPTRIYDIAIDKDGVKWLGTDNGLIRFDGKNWTVYNKFTDPDMPFYSIFRVTVDVNGVLWMSDYHYNTGGILASFDGTAWVEYTTTNSGIPYNFIYALAVDKAGNKWIGTDKGLTVFDGTNWTTYRTNNQYVNDAVYAIGIDNNDTKWVSSYRYGLASFDGLDWQVIPCDNPRNTTSIVIDTNNVKWIKHTDCIVSFNGSEFVQYLPSNSPLPSDRILSISVNEDGIKYFGVADGFDGNKGALVSFDDNEWKTVNTRSSGLEGNYIRYITCDAAGTKWILSGSEALGSYQDHQLASLMNTSWTQHNFDWKEYINVRWIVSETDGNVWMVGSIYDGLYMYPNALLHYNETADSISEYPVAQGGEVFSTTAFIVDGEGYKWIGTNIAGLRVYDGAQWISYDTLNSGLMSNCINSLAEESSGKKWIATDKGLSMFDGTLWTGYDTANSGIPGTQVSNIRIGNDGMKWMLVQETSPDLKHLVSFDDFTWTTYEPPDTLNASNIQYFEIDRNGTLWLIISPYEFVSFDGTNWTSHEKMYCPIRSFAIDADGYKWLGSDFGIFVYNENGIPYALEPNPVAGNLIKAWPNPATSDLVVETPGNGTLSVFNMNGKFLLERPAENFKTTIKVSSLPAGVYIIRYISGEKAENFKFVKH